MMKTLVFYLILCFGLSFTATSSLQAQSAHPPMQVALRVMETPQGVYLRWAPVDFHTWEWGNAHGYKLVRFSIRINGVTAPDMNTAYVLADSIKPIPESGFQPMADTSDWAGIAAGAIYGEGFKMLNLDTADISDVVNMNTEQQNRFTYSLFAAEQSFEVAKAMGLGYFDPAPLPNSEYRYIIVPANAPPEDVKSTMVFINTATPPVLPKPTLTAEGGNHTATLQWEKYGLEEHYNSYIVERSADNGNTYTRRNDKPTIFLSGNEQNNYYMFFKDSLPQNNVNYVYRVRGITSFGTTGPAADPISVSGSPDPIEGVSITVTVQESPVGKIKLDWTIPSNIVPQLTGINILRSPSVQSAYTLLNSAPLLNTATTYTDLAPGATNFYLVEAIDITGHKHQSIAMLGQPNDDTPPTAPPLPTCTCNAQGNVSITWSPSTSSDVMGYRVYAANTNNPQGLKQVTSTYISKTNYQYTVEMNTLSENTYFAVKALDFRENASPFSPICVAARPDVIAPAGPIIASYTHVTGGTNFMFRASASDDVVSYQFQRRLKGYVNWETLANILPNKISEPYLDATAHRRRYYEYRLLALDEVPLIGASSVMEIKPFDDGMRAPIVNLQAIQIGAIPGVPPKALGLTWDYPASTDLDLMGFQIMRAIGGDPLRSLQFFTTANATTSALSSNPYYALFTGTYSFLDLDAVQFKKLLQQGQVLPVPGGSGGPGPGGPGGSNGHGVQVKYVVYAKYIDGAMSPLAEVVLNY